MTPTRIAPVMTVHNRRRDTLSCLAALHEQRDIAGVAIQAFVVDDGSTDGTAAAVRKHFPDTCVIAGDGNLFWAPGMRRALAAAYLRDFDFYVWLNDDTIMDRDALARMLDAHAQLAASDCLPAIVVGATRDPDTGVVTYGGRHRPVWWKRSHFEVMDAAPVVTPAETMNGNLVLVSRDVMQRLGTIAPYRHSFGDQDYGLRARRAGVGVWVAPGTLATCARNPEPVYGRGPLKQELRDVVSIKGLLPSDWLRFSRRWHGPLWPLFWVAPYLRRALRVIAAHAGRTPRRIRG